MKEGSYSTWRTTNIKHLIKNTPNEVRVSICVPINDVFCYAINVLAIYSISVV